MVQVLFPPPGHDPSQFVAIYGRVSSAPQVRGASLLTQTDRGSEFAARLGKAVFRVYDDAGVSGAFYESRPGLQQMLTDLEAGWFDTIIFLDISRASRDTVHQQVIRRRVKAAGGTILFCDLPLEDSPEGDLVFTIMGALEAYYRDRFRRGSMRGMRTRAQNGLQPARSSSPFGYHIPTRPDVLRGLYSFDTLGKYLIVEEEAHWVRQMFTWRGEGATLSAICDRLDASAVRPPQSERGAWWMGTVDKILHNPVYKGEAVWGRRQSWTDEARLKQPRLRGEGNYTSPRDYRISPQNEWIIIPCPPLVSAEVWEKAQRRDV